MEIKYDLLGNHSPWKTPLHVTPTQSLLKSTLTTANYADHSAMIDILLVWVV